MSITGAVGAQARPLGLDEDDLRLLAAGIDVRQAMVDLKFTKSLYFMNRRSIVTRNFKALPGASYTGNAGLLTRTNSAGLVLPPGPANEPGETDVGLDVWEARTNLWINSGDLRASGWSVAGATTTDLGASPLIPGARRVGVTSAGFDWHKAQAAAGNAYGVTSGVTYAVTFFYEIGPSGKIWCELRNAAGGVGSTIAGSATAPTVTGQFAGAIANLNVRPLAGGLYCLTCVWTPNFTAATAGTGIGPFSNVSGETIIVHAAQLELGSVPSPYIPTTAAAATRTAMVPAITGLAGILTPPFTVLADISMPAIDGIARRVISLRNDGSSTLTLVRTATNELGIGSSDTSYVAISGFTGARSGKAALRVRTANRSLSFGGSAPLSVSNIALPTVDRMDIGNLSGAGQINGQIRRVLILPDMSDAALAALTA